MQFVTYGKMSGAFEEAGELNQSEIQTYCQYLGLNIERKFQNIFEVFAQEMMFSKYGFSNIETAQNKGTWGRRGVEIRLKAGAGSSYGQFGAVGLYYDTRDHGVPFKKDVPEIVFFWDVNPGYKHLLQTDEVFRELVTLLVINGYESNLDNQISSNPWRLLFYRRPISDFKIINVQEMISFTETVLTEVLRSKALLHPYFAEFQ
jgi:hypothetical protein